MRPGSVRQCRLLPLTGAWTAPVLALALALLAPAAGAASAPGGGPAITSIVASPAVIPAAGGRVVVSAGVAAGSICTFSGSGIDVLREPCADGSAGEAISFGANATPAPHLWRITLVSAGRGRGSSLRAVTIVQKGEALPASLAQTLDRCRPGPGCDYGPFESRYPSYGNVAPANIGDCAFAAAADWEQIVLGATPAPATVTAAFAAAGGRARGGLPLAALWSYWQSAGIAGVRLDARFRYPTAPARLEHDVRADAAVLVEFRFAGSETLAQYAMSPGFHLAVVDGFTPTGPLVVSWGRTLQMRWSQWRTEAIAVWGLAAD